MTELEYDSHTPYSSTRNYAKGELTDAKVTAEAQDLVATFKKSLIDSGNPEAWLTEPQVVREAVEGTDGEERLVVTIGVINHKPTPQPSGGGEPAVPAPGS